MSAWLYALGRWCYRRRKTVIGIWLALLIGLGGAAVAFMGSFNNAFEIPASRSQEALDRLRMTFPEGAALSAMAIVVAPDGQDIEEFRPEVEDAIAEFDDLDMVLAATSPWNEYVSGLISDSGEAAIVQLSLDRGSGEMSAL